MTRRYPGCHGIQVQPEDVGFELGFSLEQPPRSVRVEILDRLADGDDRRLVWAHEEPPSHGYPSIRSEAWREAKGSVWWTNNFDTQLRVDPTEGSVSIASRNAAGRHAVLEALANIALPMLAQLNGAYVLHGAAASLDGAATVICATGGSGKSTLAAGLVSLGWEPISEDQCVIDTSSVPVVWPGPSWVHLLHDAPVRPPVREQRFAALDKVSWDVAPWVRHAPTPLCRLVVLEPPEGRNVVWEPLPPPDVIPLLARQSIWMDDADRFAATVFPHAAAIALAVPAYRMRLPRRDGWLDDALALLGGAGGD